MASQDRTKIGTLVYDYIQIYINKSLTNYHKIDKSLAKSLLMSGL